MIIDDNNTSSIRGVMKAGFVVELGEVERDKMKRYVHVEEKRL